MSEGGRAGRAFAVSPCYFVNTHGFLLRFGVENQLVVCFLGKAMHLIREDVRVEEEL